MNFKKTIKSQNSKNGLAPGLDSYGYGGKMKWIEVKKTRTKSGVTHT